MTPEEWKVKWPHHCEACGGWGQSATYYDNHGVPGPGEPCSDPCEAIDDLRICHRCSAPGLSEDGEGPCSECGWNFDDGVPEEPVEYDEYGEVPWEGWA
jgi:hypothetical protein